VAPRRRRYRRKPLRRLPAGQQAGLRQPERTSHARLSTGQDIPCGRRDVVESTPPNAGISGGAKRRPLHAGVSFFSSGKPLRCQLFPWILKRLQECIRERRYVATLHTEEEMNNDELSILDVERVILTGEIIERQRDKETGEWKYLVRGPTLEGTDAVVVTKLSPTGKMVILTVFADE